MAKKIKQDSVNSHDLTYYAREKAKFLRDNKELSKMYKAMGDMWHNHLVLPSELTQIEGFHQVIPTEPSDAIQTGRRILATVEPKITYHPLDNNIETRQRADYIEKALGWHYKLASRRSVSNLTSDVVLSSLLYDAINCYVEYIPWQDKLSGQAANKSWDSNGDFAITVYNPGDVYVKRTNRGVRTVLLYTELTPEDVIDTWGDKAEKIIQDFADTNGKEKLYPDTVFYCDRWDDTDRLVWLEFSRDDTEIKEEHVILREPHKLPFIPWVSRAGGSSIDREPQFQRRPILTSVYQARSWLTDGIMESLLVTESIKTGAAPLTSSVTMDGKSPRIDYTVIGGNVALKPGETIQHMQKPAIDQRLVELTDRLAERMGTSTLPKILSNPSFSAKAAFAAVNAILHAASNALDPARLLAETALSDLYTLELRWLIHTKSDLYAYDFMDKKSDNYGSQFVVKSAEIDPRDIYIDVKLSANLPLDQVAQINATSLLKDKFGISKERALEMLDFTDAESLVEEGIQEALNDAEVSKVVASITAEGQAAAKNITDAQALETQRKQMEMQQQAQQQQAQQQQAQQQQAQEQQQQAQMAQQQPQQGPAGQDMSQQMPPGAPPQMGGGQPTPGMDAMQQQQGQAQSQANLNPDETTGVMSGLTQNMGGQGFNPAMGGQSPSGAMPGQLTREKKKRKTRGGNPIFGA